MSEVLTSVQALPELVLASPVTARRRLVALAGPPASGKSSLAEKLAEKLTALGQKTAVVPMDGFHLDNRVLSSFGLLSRKGSPQSFDALGLLRLLPALKSDQDVFYPIFDRKLDMAIAGAGHLPGDCDIVIVEGNYLLFDAPVWRDMTAFWDLSIRLDVPVEVLEYRLRERWRFFGFSGGEVEEKISINDLPNAKIVAENTLPSHVVLKDQRTRT